MLVDEAVALAGRVILLRRVSGSPGAEGAPFEGRVCRVVVLVVELGWEVGGAMRRDWNCLLVGWKDVGKGR